MKKRSHGRVSRRLGDLEALLRHLLDLGQEATFSLAEALDVDHVAADETSISSLTSDG